MNLKKIAALTLAPAAVTGIAVSTWATAQASSHHTAAQPADLGRAERTVGHQGRPAANLSTRALADQARTRRAAARQLAAVHRAAARKERAARARAAHAHAASSSASSNSLLAGMTPFEQCVAYRESGDNPTDPAGLFGILPQTWASLGYSGTAGQASVALQKQAFNRLYAMYGTSPWAPYDGC